MAGKPGMHKKKQDATSSNGAVVGSIEFDSTVDRAYSNEALTKFISGYGSQSSHAPVRADQVAEDIRDSAVRLMTAMINNGRSVNSDTVDLAIRHSVDLYVRSGQAAKEIA